MRRPLVAVAACVTLLVAGCGSDSHAGHADPAGHAGHGAATTSSSPASPSAQAPAGGAASASAAAAPAVGGDWNLADVMFLQMAIANHKRGIELVQLADKHQVRADVRNLADAIRLTQEQEVSQMSKWLTDWKQPVEVSGDPSAHAHHGGMPLTDPQTIAELDAQPDGQFEKQFVTILTGHQHNAVEFALTEKKDGANADVKAFADKVVKSRTAQIQQLLNFSQ
ncbi:DUF305 domain-containing protein [Actinokineospora auranticolor]|uniref:Uncharacterized protein (DUF305 family) n=1 Tax=Actinokineospora auranticolor TaxID=155976 RepID=A0A2S6GM86_9PSEU|nr:DUF305 domain-containing protein [Actinokineospora auranticolor]PPK66335.1 uncharacterized protein (DUF305 family) [Actinokineospora auranticolor]